MTDSRAADESTRHHAVVPSRLAGRRLDQVLAELFPDFSRTRLKSWILAGQVQVDDRVPKPRDRVAGGERIDLVASRDRAVESAPQAIPLDVVFDDDQLIVVNKPAGLVVHPGAGNPDRTLQNALLHHLPELAALPRAGLIHRLDKDTSGLLLVARTLEAHTRLVRAMQTRGIQRVYEAVVYGVMTGGGTVDAPIGRHPRRRTRMAVRTDGRRAVSQYRVLQRFRAHTHVHISLDTGRTHQIRVHMAHIGHPLVGDPVYGRRLAVPAGASDALRQTLRGFKRQALHARTLAFAHPATGGALRFEAPLPDDLRALLAALAADTAEAVAK